MAVPRRTPLDQPPSKTRTAIMLLIGLLLVGGSVVSRSRFHWFAVGLFSLGSLAFADRLYRFYRRP
jgi:hypothetical protein